jgi:methylphosphotriester-DNA--protein-cysteine methyltransferase
MRWELFFMTLLDSMISRFVKEPMIYHKTISTTELKRLIQSDKIMFGGNAKLKIYGTLDCSSGKRMKKENRVFFSTEQEALTVGYRPCGHCLSNKYVLWKKQISG